MMMTRRYCLTIKKDTKRERCKEEQIPRVVTNIMTRALGGGAISYIALDMKWVIMMVIILLRKP